MPFFQCKLYDDIRHKFLLSILHTNKSLFEFYRILSQNYPDIVKQTAQDIFQMVKRRKDLDMYIYYVNVRRYSM